MALRMLQITSYDKDGKSNTKTVLKNALICVTFS